MPSKLAQWLRYQEQVNPRGVDLGLDRVRAVWQRMGGRSPARCVVTVGGTNGKGSTVALLESMFRAFGWRTGAYISPHLPRYNERICLNGVELADAEFIASFERIEAARGKTLLTYFEFATLAALDLFTSAQLDVALLEVGLGGRLDAVNIVGADVAVITSIGLDHTAWLGPDRDSIGREKAGIARRGRPVIIGDPDPPAGLLNTLTACGARSELAGRDFIVQRQRCGWRWHHADGIVLELPDPAMAGSVQYANGATAIAALHALRTNDKPVFTKGALAATASAGLRHARVPARLQSLGGDPELIVDVAHNPQAAQALVSWLMAQPAAPVHAVYGALDDKNVAGVLGILGPHVRHWHLAGLDGESLRGLAATTLVMQAQKVLPRAVLTSYVDVSTALDAARAAAQPGHRILAFGSFFLVSAVLRSKNTWNDDGVC